MQLAISCSDMLILRQSVVSTVYKKLRNIICILYLEVWFHEEIFGGNRWTDGYSQNTWNDEFQFIKTSNESSPAQALWFSLLYFY